MDRFKIGDKVFSKQGDSGGEGIGTVYDITGDGKIGVRFFKDNSKDFFSPEEVLTEDESKAQFNEWKANLPRNSEVNFDPYE